MKRILLSILATLLLYACDNAALSTEVKEPRKAPLDYLFMQRAYPNGRIDPVALEKTAAYKRAKLDSKSLRSSVSWEFAGPENIGGRITDIEIPVDASEVYYVGAASGGIFKTTDGGANWLPIFDEVEYLSIGDMEISKSNTDLIWVGTGESNAGGGSLAYDGNGVYQSTDGGLTWTNKGLTNAGSIAKVLIDPNDDNTVYAAAMGELFENSSNRGVYKSTDSGLNWEKVLFISDSTGIIDMVNHPTDSDILYAAAWERVRRPRYRSYGGPTSGIYRSLDGGASWDELTNGLPTAGSQKGRISIAIAPSNPNVLYARYANAIGHIQGVYRTNNGGDTWTAVNSSQLTNVGFHWWFRGIYVDPLDESTIYNVDFVVQKSVDGGNSWFTAFPGVHVDQHALAFNAQNNNEVLLGNDGGVYKSNNNGASSTKYLNLPITQFYRFYVDPQNPDKIYGGSQDNSTMRTTTGSLDDWNIIFGGDGFQPLVAADNTNVIYALSQRGNLVKSTNNAANFSSATSGITSADRNNWDTPVVFDPQDPQTLYYGTQRVWKTTNATASWTPISPDLTNGDGGGNLTFGTITTMDVSAVDQNTIVAGTDDANVWITQDGGSNWTNISSNLPNLWTTKVLADRTDANTIYVTFSGYRYADDASHVFKSTDAGASWTAIGNGLPDVPVNDIVKDTYGNLYLATDVGVFSSNNEGADWMLMDNNLPAVPVTDLHIDEAQELLYAATYGRSAYKADISGDVLSTTNRSPLLGIKIYPNPASEQLSISLPPLIQAVDLVCYDASGRIVHQDQMDTNNNTVNIAHLKPGIYLLKLADHNSITSRKLIIH
ncbi:MAG: T9SS type A sorting domain-containing protein [Bacteroidota bacterium]